MTGGAARRPHQPPGSAELPEAAALGRWTAILAAAAICITIGLPLIGLGVFHAGDLLLSHAPWDVTVPPSFRPSNPLLGDTVNNEVPMHAEFRRRVYDGDFPLWLSFPSGGRPLGTVPDAGTLGPLALPYLLVPLWYSPALSKLLEMLVAGGFTALFLRRVGLGRAAALVGGIVYMGSGFQVVWTNWPQPRVGAWIPALFWALERGLQERRASAFLPVPLITAALLLEGFPSVAGYGLMAAAAYVAVRLLAARRASAGQRVRLSGFAVGAVALGLGLAATQLLPLAERIGQLDLGYRLQSSEAHLPVVTAATAVVPNALGSPADGTYFGPLNYVEIQNFVGVVAALLAAVELVRWRSDVLAVGVRGYLWAATAVAAILVYVGGPLLALFQGLWLFEMNPVGRVRSVLGFFLACLAAAGFEALRRPLRPAPRWLAAGAWIAAAGVAAFLARRIWIVADAAGRRDHLLEQSLLPAVVLLAAAAVIGFGRRVRLGGLALALWVLPALLVVESVTFASGFLPKIDRDRFYPSTPAHAFLRENLDEDRFASGGLAMAPGTSSYYELRSLTSNTFYPPTWAEAITVVDDDAFTNSPLLPVLDSNPEVATSPVLDRLAVRYFVTPPEALFGERTPGGRLEGPPVTVKPEGAIVGSVPAAGLRGVSARLVDPPERPFTVRVDLVDVTGATVATGSRRILRPTSGKVLIPVAEPGSVGRVRVRLGVSGIRGPLSVAGRGAGEAALGTVGADDGLRLVFADGVLIYERPDALARIRWAGRASVIEDQETRLAALEAPADPGSVLLSEPGPRTVDAAAGSVELVEDRSDELVIRVRAAEDGYVVVADAMQDGWTATVDGRGTPVLDAEHAAVAVFVPKGEHEVRLLYAPSGWRLGLLITVASVATVAILAAFVAVRRRRRRGMT